MAKLPPPDPRYLKALPLMQDAVEHYRRDQPDQAEELFLRALKKAPDHPDALYFLALIRMDRGKPDDALRLLAKASKSNPRFAEAHFLTGSILNALGRPKDALPAYQRALAIDASHVNALNHLGNTLRLLRKPEEAIAAFDKAIALAPNFAEAHSNKGVALAELKRLPEAITCYDRALAVNPNFPDALSNRGAALLILSRPDEALACFDRALALNPNYPEAINNRGSALQDLNRHHEALTWHHKALGFNPNNSIAHLCLATAHLALGEYDVGWREYEWRWGTADLVPFRRDLRRPQWRGDEALDGKTILLHAEQGYGDMLQFARYVPLVAERGADVVIEAPRALTALLGTIAGKPRIIGRGDKLPAFDVHCPLLSLPLAFGTRVDTIPAAVPYVSVPADRLTKWTDRLADHAGRKIGLAWSGRPHPRDRSIPLAELKPLLSLPGTQFVSLQQELQLQDVDLIAAQSNLLHVGAEIEDFGDTAALIAALDLIITIDTSVAHLAGAMGKPVWILLLCGADFRWLVDRDDTPWYPTAKLFRQRAVGDWASVITRVADALRS
jgi:tetratricopeptide (TPR) repeat protein